jgi:hypothetical protein
MLPLASIDLPRGKTIDIVYDRANHSQKVIPLLLGLSSGGVCNVLLKIPLGIFNNIT